MDEGSLDRDAMARLAKALHFICGADHPVAQALSAAAASGKPAEIKKARAQFLKLKPSERQAALAMLDD